MGAGSRSIGMKFYLVRRTITCSNVKLAQDAIRVDSDV